MNEQVANAVRIARQFQFTSFDLSIKANESGNAQHSITQCENHLDENYMKLLEQDAHLDFDKYPF